MPIFYYKAVNSSGEIQEGEMSAKDQQMVISRLQKQGFTPIRADLLNSGQQTKNTQKIKQDDIAMFTDELSTLLNAGMPLDKAFETLIDLAEKQAVQDMLISVRDDIRGGSSLADAFEAREGIFSRFYINMIKAGEIGSALDKVLIRLNEFLERSKELKETVKSALIYPMILVSVAGLSVVILLTFVVPQFTPMFEDAGKALPVPTQIVIAMGDFFRDFWWLLAFILLGIASFFKSQFAHPKSRYFWDKKLLKLGLVGDLITKMEVARFTRTLGTLLENGVTLLTALAIMKETITNTVIAESVSKVSTDVKEGKGLSDPMAETGVFPKLVIQLVRVGEETGQLQEMLVKVANIYDKEVKASVQRMLALLEPLLILSLGLMISGIIFSILLAILSVNELAI